MMQSTFSTDAPAVGTHLITLSKQLCWIVPSDALKRSYLQYMSPIRRNAINTSRAELKPYVEPVRSNTIDLHTQVYLSIHGMDPHTLIAFAVFYHGKYS